MTTVFSLQQTITLSPEVLTQEVSGEMVLLDLKNEQYLGLNEVGTRIWQLLKENSDLNSVFSTLLNEFEVDKETLQRDLEQLINDMVQAGIATLEETESASE